MLFTSLAFFICFTHMYCLFFFFFFQAEDGIRDSSVTGVQTCALPISRGLDVLTIKFWLEAPSNQNLMVKTSKPRAGDSAESPSVTLDRDRLTRRERSVWRLALLLLGAVTIAFAAISWEQVRALPHHLEALPVGLVVLVALFVAYAWRSTNEISELRGIVRG